jgi:ubiquinone/menaquinone biosynthesis C-methylase UbiE
VQKFYGTYHVLLTIKNADRIIEDDMNGSNDDAGVTKTARLFDALAADYDAVGVEFFGPIAHGLVAELHTQPGEVVADLGCGKGAVSLPLASAMGTSRRVDALDISAAMVSATRTAAAENGPGNVIASPRSCHLTCSVTSTMRD